MGVYTYDTGGDVSTLELVAADYLTLLAPLKCEDASVPGPRGPYLKSLCQLPTDPSEELIVSDTRFDYFGPLPGVYVVLGSGDVIGKALSREIDWQQSVRVYVASGSPGRLVGGRLTDAADAQGKDPGILGALAHVIESLQGAALPSAPGASSIRVQAHAPVYHDPKLSLWVVSTQVKVVQAVCPDRDDALVDRFQADHDADGAGVVATQEKFF